MVVVFTFLSLTLRNALIIVLSTLSRLMGTVITGNRHIFSDLGDKLTLDIKGHFSSLSKVLCKVQERDDYFQKLSYAFIVRV